jgi:hypothetical protein
MTMGLRRLLVLLTLLLSSPSLAQQQKDCEADGTCSSECQFQVEHGICRDDGSIYANGGTAMAYVPNQALKRTVCGSDTKAIYKQATWPFSRSIWKESPRLSLRINVLGCASERNDDGKNERCCCENLVYASEIEVWQTRPDGSYPSIREGTDECRATAKAGMVLVTLAPGSTGTLNGLGPGKLDLPWYGRPVIHVLAKAPGYASTLVDLPISINMKTMEPGSFFGPDFRGSAWVRSRSGNPRHKVVSWKGNPTKNHIEIEVDIYLAQGNDDGSVCLSSIYGLPSAFLTEPVAVCGPTLLDFFDL